MVEQTADHLTGGIEAGDRLLAVGDDLSAVVDLNAAKREADAAGYGVAGVGRGVDKFGPVALGWGDATVFRPSLIVGL